MSKREKRLNRVLKKNKDIADVNAQFNQRFFYKISLCFGKFVCVRGKGKL